MRILIVNQFFWPDIAPTGRYLCDVARHLVDKGHEVTVICSGGSYASTIDAEEEPPPVRVIRIPGFRYQRSALGRLLSYSVFFVGAFWHQLRVPKPDLVVSMTTPPLLAVAGALVKALRGTRHLIWEMDVFPDVLVALGALAPTSMVTGILSWIQRQARNYSDGVVALGPCMRNRLLANGMTSSKIYTAENWADGQAISPGPNRDTGPLNIFYSGNFGLTHDVDTIAEVMRRLRNDSRFVFTFAGGGVGRSQLQLLCAKESIGNVKFLPYVDQGDLNDHFGLADIGLVTERATCLGTVVPSKTYALMAASRPVLFIGPKDATPALLIDHFQCGWQVTPGNANAVVQLLISLAVCREVIWECGRRARTAFDSHYDLAHGVARVAQAFVLAASARVSESEVVVSTSQLTEPEQKIV